MTADGETGNLQPLTTGDTVSLTIRTRVPADDSHIVEIYNRQERDGMPLSLERYRAEHTETPEGRQGEEWMAAVGDRAVGVAAFSPAWWTGIPTAYEVEVRVDPDHERQGLGTQLFDRLRSQLHARGATRLSAWVRADSERGRRFATRHGFTETGEVIREYRLHLPDAKFEDAEAAEARLRSEGLRIASLAELGEIDDAFLRDLHRVWADSGEGSPDAPDAGPLHDPLPAWRKEVLDGHGLSPETHWVALDGDRPVGMTFLKRLSEDAAENDYTGVASTHRGRGIARALKGRVLAWALRHGVRWFYTSSEVGNAPMIAVNTRLGYRPGVERRKVARDFP